MTVDKAIPLIPDQRRESLMALLAERRILSIAELTVLMGVSHMTVRRDIAALVEADRVVAVPGGVRLQNAIRDEPTFGDKAMKDVAEKHAIAARASALVHDHQTIYLDAGTTTGAMIPWLRELRDLTVVTNDFAIVEGLSGAEGVEIIHAGGAVDQPNRSTVGRIAARTVRSLHTDVAFISTSSWDLDHGVTTPADAKVAVKQAAVDAASESVLLAASGKYGRYGLYEVFRLQELDLIITDDRLRPSVADTLREADVELQLASPASASSA